MRFKKNILSLFLIGLVFFGFRAYAQEDFRIKNSPKVEIAFILDGESSQNKQIADIFKKEIKRLLEPEYKVFFDDENIVSGHWSYDLIKNKSEELLDNKDVDVIVSLGYMSSCYLSKHPEAKDKVVPLFAYGVEANTNLHKDNIYLVSNFTPINLMNMNAKKFMEYVPFKKLGVLVNKHYLNNIDGYEDKIIDSFKDLPVEVKVIDIDRDFKFDLAEKLDDVDAVYILPMLHLGDEDLSSLVDVINDKKLPSFMPFGTESACQKALLTKNSYASLVKIARETSLNTQRVLSDKDIKLDYIPSDKASGFILNMQTARKISFSPTWKLLHNAQIKGSVDINKQKITLVDLIYALDNDNLDLVAKNHELDAALRSVKIEKSGYLPGLYFGTNYNWFSNSIADLGIPKRSGNLGIGFTQVLFSDGLNAKIFQSKKMKDLTKEQREELRLNLTTKAAISYVNLLKFKNLIDTQKDYIENAKTNLKLAKSRNVIGYSGDEDIYRWESIVALKTTELRKLEAEFGKIQTGLNKLLSRDLNKTYYFEDVTTNSPVLMTSKMDFINKIDTPEKLEQMTQSIYKKSTENAPELKQIDNLIAVKERESKVYLRKHYMPNIVANGNYANMFSQKYTTSSRGFDEASNISVNANWELFKGGANIEHYKKSKDELLKLKTERENTLLELEKVIRNHIKDALASYCTIELANKANESARKSYKIVQDRYKAGTASVTQLVDEQNNLLEANKKSKNVLYDYIINVLCLQRSLNKVDFSLMDDEWQAWIDNLGAKIEQDEIMERL